MLLGGWHVAWQLAAQKVVKRGVEYLSLFHSNGPQSLTLTLTLPPQVIIFGGTNDVGWGKAVDEIFLGLQMMWHVGVAVTLAFMWHALRTLWEGVGHRQSLPQRDCTWRDTGVPGAGA